MTDCFRVQTSYSQNWPCWNIWHSRRLCKYWLAETKAESAPYLGRHDVLPSRRSTFWRGRVPLSPRDLRPWYYL